MNGSKVDGMNKYPLSQIPGLLNLILLSLFHRQRNRGLESFSWKVVEPELEPTSAWLPSICDSPFLTLLPYMCAQIKRTSCAVRVKSERFSKVVCPNTGKTILPPVGLGHRNVEGAKRWHQGTRSLTSFHPNRPLIFPALTYMLSYFSPKMNRLCVPQGETFRNRKARPRKLIWLHARTRVSGIGGEK